jgi:hypothetical protein
MIAIRLLLAAALSLTGLAACAAQDTFVTPVDLSGDAAVTTTGRLAWRGGFSLSLGHEGFGGLSALELSDDGSRILALSDSAWWVTADLGWSADNRLERVADIRVFPLLDEAGRHWRGRAADSEGLTRTEGTTYLVSFEREHRVLAYDLGPDWTALDTARPTPIDIPPGSERWGDNRGLESLARLNDGTLLAGVEYPSGLSLNHAIWRRPPGGEWQAGRMSATPTFGLTGLAAHDGWVYVVERFWARGQGNRIRIRRFPADADWSTPAQAETLGALDAPLITDNIEGIAVMERGGETLILLLSDDNFSRSQRTLLLAFAVTDQD